MKYLGFVLICGFLILFCECVAFAVPVGRVIPYYPITDVVPLKSYIVIPNITCSIPKDCFYNSALLGCKDIACNWCCYDSCSRLNCGDYAL
jgi:hypothetical protein